MDFFERLRRAAGNIPWGQVASVMAENLGAGTVAAQEVIEQLKEWGSHLTKNALSKWTVSVVTPTPCESPDVSSGRPKSCGSYAVVKCDCAGATAASPTPESITWATRSAKSASAKRKRECGRLTGYARPQGHKSPPKPEAGMSRADALRTLKLRAEASWPEIKVQYRKLVVKHNADQPQSDAQRAKNTERLKKINVAFAALKQEHEKQEAA